MLASNTPGTLETTSRLLPAGPSATADHARWLCEQLELGHILFFAETPFELAPTDREFLLSQRQTAAGYHKNVAYRPHEDRLTGLGRASEEDKQRLRAIREAKNLFQGDMEKQSGLRRAYMSRVEHGHTLTSVETLRQVGSGA